MWATLVGIIMLITINRATTQTTNTTTTTTTTTTSTTTRDGKYPCAYADTVNITDGLRLKDGSYSIGNVVVPPHLMAEYNFKVIDGVEYRTAKHLRGCVCLLKPCITFCCSSGQVFNPEHGNCTKTEPDRKITHIELTNSNRSVDHVRIIDKFVVRTELGCRNKLVDKKRDSFWQWDLYANGSLLRDDRLWSTDEYCFTAVENSKVWTLTPLNCERFQRGYRVWIYAICKSNPCQTYCLANQLLCRQHHCHIDQHLYTVIAECN